MTLGELLELTPTGADTFSGVGYEYSWGGLYCGHIVAQALRAAAFTVEEGFLPHSLRAYFIRRGDNTCHVDYDVDRIRDGRSFCTRRVVARQSGDAILNLEASFQVAEETFEISPMASVDDLPAPDVLPDASWMPFLERRNIEMEDVYATARGGLGRTAAWMKTSTPLGGELLNRCALAFLSDDLPTESVVNADHRFRKASDEGRRFSASLDHTIWFHRPVAAHEWHLYEMSCVNYTNGRGLAQGYVFAVDGTHVATIAQETLVRIRPE
jgi:acyl-CoA thioesterase-2